nr:hypothetical protein [Sulfurimonas sp. SAG-AH-194-L11]
MQFFEHLDKQHEAWHKSYSSIYKIFLEDKKRGVFGKLLDFGESKSMKMDKAKLYYSELQEETKELLKTADAAIRRVSALQESKFN